MLKELHDTYADETKDGLEKVKQAAVQNNNMFEQLMEICKYASSVSIDYWFWLFSYEKRKEPGGNIKANL